MFGNTLDFVMPSGTVTATKINQDGYSSEYLAKDALSQLTIRIRHSKTGAKLPNLPKDRHNVEVVRTIFATPTVPERSQKAYFVLEQLPSDVDLDLMVGLASWALADVNSALISLMNWES